MYLFSNKKRNFFLLIHKSLVYNYLIGLCFSLFFNVQAVAQQKYLKSINDKISNVKKQVKNDSLYIQGVVKLFGGARLLAEKNSKPIEYRVQANLNLKYKGISIPLSYNFSNGRSLYRINGPNVNVPKLNNLGISPSYKWAKVHLGTRSMSFSRYTYDNLRFTGAGFEINPGQYHLKYFKGKIFQSSVSDLQLANNLTLPYERKAWGMMGGYLSKSAEYSMIVFKAHDDFSGVTDTTVYSRVKPRANTSVGTKIKQKLFNKIDINYQWAVSALTYNEIEEPIYIPTHWTIYNMLGLYVKKASSKYTYAKTAELTYNTEGGSVGLKFERVDKDYKSLGSMVFDNNYKAYTTTYSNTFFKKLNVNAEAGFRNDGISKEAIVKATRWIWNINSAYTLSEYIGLNATFSNFRNVERNYYLTINSNNFDSVGIALVNRNLNLSTNIALNKKKSAMLNFSYSNQHSNRIQTDSLVVNSKQNNNLINAAYVYQTKKLNLAANLSLLRNMSENIFIQGFIPSVTFGFKINDNMDIRSNTTFSNMKTQYSTAQSLIMSQDYNYKISKNQEVIFTNRLNFSTNQKKLAFRENMISLDYTYRF